MTDLQISFYLKKKMIKAQRDLTKRIIQDL